MLTLRNKPSLCELRRPRSERAICLGVLCIDSLRKRTDISCCRELGLSLNARLIVRPNAQTRGCFRYAERQETLDPN
jgi:hypothetical protein